MSVHFLKWYREVKKNLGIIYSKVSWNLNTILKTERTTKTVNIQFLKLIELFHVYTSNLTS